MTHGRFCLDCGTFTTGASRCKACGQLQQKRDNGSRHSRQRMHGRDTARWRRLAAMAKRRDKACVAAAWL